MSKQRLVRPGDLPETLWGQEHSHLHLTPHLIGAWQHLLNVSGMSQQALQPVPPNIVGGIDEKSTNDHLAWRFTGSSARVQLAMLDPHSHLSNVADAFTRIFSGGTVLLLDIPCGSGAAAISILTTLAELRRQECIPRTPLIIKLIGGELSEFARNYAAQGIEHIRSSLKDQAILVEAEFLSWDALCKFSTGDLIKRLTILGQDCSARALILANFSGFLQHGDNWKKAAPQFENLFVHNRDQHSVAIWIEPQTNKVVKNGGFINRLQEWFLSKFSSLIGTENDKAAADIYESSAVDAQHPLQKDHQFLVNLAVQRFELSRTQENP